MKTIREIVGQSVGGPLPEFVVKALEAREKERDELERERIRKAVGLAFKARFNIPTEKFLLEFCYPPPGPEKLPAGYWWTKFITESKWQCSYQPVSFEPHPNWEWRRGDDPPPEVAGKAALPTAQEWIEKHVVSWNVSVALWYKASAFSEKPFRNVPDEIFDKLKPLVGELTVMAVYHSCDEALADLKRVLIEMGLAR